MNEHVTDAFSVQPTQLNLSWIYTGRWI